MGNIDFRVFGGGGGGLLSIFIGSGGVNSEENPGLSISCGCFFGGMGGGVPGVSMVLTSLSLRSDEKLELRGVQGVCGEAGSGLRGLDRLSWDETPWNRERVSRRSPNCKLLGLCCFSGGVSSASEGLSSRTWDLLTLHSFLFFLAILLSSSERDKIEVLRSLGRDNKESWEEMQEGPSEDAEPLERPEEALERVETVDMRRRVEDRM